MESTGTKVIRGGFKPLAPVYPQGDPDKRYLLPQYPPKSNDFYELSGDGRITDRYFANKKAAADRKASSAAQNGSQTASESSAKPIDKPSVLEIPKGIFVRSSNESRRNKLLQENIPPRSCKAPTQDDRIIGIGAPKVNVKYEENADDHTKYSSMLKSLAKAKIDAVNKKGVSNHNASDKLMDQSKSNEELTRDWVFVQNRSVPALNPNVASKLNKIINYQEPADFHDTHETTEPNATKSLESQGNDYIDQVCAGDAKDTQKSTPSPTLSDDGSAEYGIITICYQTIPGDRSGLNQRTGRSRADLEMAMHRQVIQLYHPHQQAYSPEQHLHQSSLPENDKSEEAEEFEDVFAAPSVNF